ncbi:MAG TPA: DUF5615 family PIN-like protein [Solirubrobacteraceae bacterium]|nr:DUF5615 family PIN-like protein [Solirubrobacteraceae bacterium]
MKIFLDAHISGPRVATALRASGHDVRAADEERELDGFTDEQLLSLASEEGRILITFDVKDFPVIVRRWAEGGRKHTGCAIVVGIDHGEFGAILEAVERELQAQPEQGRWVDYTMFVARASTVAARRRDPG